MLDQGLQSIQYTFSADNLSEAGKLYRGASPSNDGTELSTAIMPDGVPIKIAPERREEFSPGLDPELLALIQATVVKLYRLHARNQSWRLYSRALLMENKWRAARYGIQGKLIDFGEERESPEKELLLEYLAWVDDVLDERLSRERQKLFRDLPAEARTAAGGGNDDHDVAGHHTAMMSCSFCLRTLATSSMCLSVIF